ncbi:MAG: alkaline phosphatase [Oscillospiraceae bacterium]|nr:alkaline phosphatase [Oscillospiraceae bacterium]
MNKKHFISKFTALWLVIALLATLMLPGCGNKPTPPVASDAATGTIATGSVIPDSTGQTEGAGESQNTPKKAVKNVIYMIADGGGYDNFTLAGKVKEEMVDRGVNKLAGAKTEISTNLLSALGKSTTKGLYLNEFLVGSANTLLQIPHGNADNYKSYITDSAAAGTALSSGYKTTYCYAGIDSEKAPRASLPELARLNDMATGLVTTKSFVDATPLAFFTSHIIHRYEYQDSSMQALLSGIDVVIGEGTEYGDMVEGATSSHPDLSASTAGYTVAQNKTELLQYANNPATKKLWASILGVDNSSKGNKTTPEDLAASHISYDIDAKQSTEQPSLLEMTKAALQVLATNIDDPDGFFLMIEGGALDNAAESGYLRPAIGEYLAFDEAFGYCVSWAAQRGDTIVIAVPDHDSGGFSGIEKCEEALIDGIITGKIGTDEIDSLSKFNVIQDMLDCAGADTSDMKLHGNHTDMAVPICLYAPDSIKTNLLTDMGLPTEKGNVRTGNGMYYVPNAGDSYTWYTSPALNNEYTIDNTKIAPAIAKALKLGTLEEATAILYNKVGSVKDGVFTGEYGGKIVFSGDVKENSYAKYRDCTYVNESANINAQRNMMPVNSQDAIFNKMALRSIFVLDERLEPENGSFYVPYTKLVEGKLAWTVTITYPDRKMPTVLLGKGTGDITLPDTPGMTYTDGAKTYNPGDTISYTGSNVALTVN